MHPNVRSAGRASRRPSEPQELLEKRAIIALSLALLSATAALLARHVPEHLLDVSAAADERGLSTIPTGHARTHVPDDSLPL